jgi:plasmid stabilization system protein ParE
MAIKIPIGANASEAIREAKKTGDAIENIGDSLDVLARESARSSREASKSFEDISDGVKDAAREVDRDAKKIGDNLSDGVERGTEKAEDSIKEYEKTFKQSVKDMQRTDGKGGLGSNLADDMKKGTHEAGESVSTFKDEAKSNLSEVASSFSGDITSVVDLVQGTLGGVVADLGPIGLAAGAAAAVGVGLIGAAISGTQEDTEVFRQRISDLATDLIETGRTGSASLGYIADKLKEMATTTDDSATSLQDLRQAADRSGSSYKDLARSAAGHTDEIDKQIKAIVKQKDEWQQSGQAALEADDALGSSANNRTKALDDTIGYLRDAKKAAKEAADEQKNYAEAGGIALQANAEAVESYGDSVASAFQEAGDAQQGFTDDGVFNLDRYISKTSDSVKQLEDYSANMAKATGELGKSGHDEAIRYLENLGPDAAPLIAAFVNAPAAQQDTLARLWDGLGSTSASNFGSGLQGGLNSQGNATKGVTIVTDLAQFNRDMAEATRQREVHIKVYEDNQGGRRQGMGTP